jgi:ABC-type sugar transport system ATPase subunit
VTPRLKTQGIVKTFGGTRALAGVDFQAESGEIHAILGENGAGKSTLMKILCGALSPDQGTVELDGSTVHFSTPQNGLDAGVSIVHQQFTLIPEQSIAENIFLGRIPINSWGVVDRKKLFHQARALLERLDSNLDPKCIVKNLGAGECRIVEIARALSRSAKVLILDEPSAVLGPRELSKLFAILHKLKSEHCTILYISHRLEEIFEIADTVTILRDGRSVGMYPVDKNLKRPFLISRMVGREWNEQFPKKLPQCGSEKLSVSGLTRNATFEDVSFNLHAGEIVGLAGLVGSGRTEVCKCIIGVSSFDSGTVAIDGQTVQISSPREALDKGIAYLSEDRHREGVINCRSVGENITMASMRRFTQNGFLKLNHEKEFIRDMMQKTDVRATSRHQLVGSLSGGNQQKVALGKWLSTEAKIFLLDEPTAGVDVGAKTEIYNLINDLARSGAAILLVSSDIPEVISICSRVLVMKQGRIIRALEDTKVTEKAVLEAAL